VTGRAALATAGPGLRLEVRPETTELRADGHDLAYVPIAFTDQAGTLLPLADRSVTVRVDGPATLLGFGSGEPITTEAFSGDTHTTFYGRALAVIRAGHESGDVTLTVTAQGCESVRVQLHVGRDARDRPPRTTSQFVA
jgi:beta-galactosidase